jgi:4'-phosphopantetheinyl transferase
MSTADWRRVQQHPDLAAGEIHVWRIRLNLPVAGSSPLSGDELQRAERLRDAVKRAQFIAGRSGMRTLLGEYTHTHPRDLRFTYGPHGKPSLPDSQLQFNFSNSGGMALLAVSIDRAIGIDIEHRDRTIRVDSLAQHIFTEAELAAFNTLPGDARHAALLTAWTRKEAYIKALGTGFSLSLKSFSVAVPADKEPAVLELRDSTDKQINWKFVPLVTHPDYIATLTAPGTDWIVCRFDCS